MWPIGRQVRQIVDNTADKLADTASDTKAAMTGLAVLGVAALAVALIALVVAVRKDQA